MDYLFYKSLHIISVVALIIGLVLVVLGYVQNDKKTLRKWGFIIHGVSWLMVLSTAFGLVSALHLHSNFPTWAWGKTILLILLGVGVIVVKRKPQWPGWHITLIFMISSLAIYLAVYKPSF